jgi:phosphate transport system substrate-binding protein
MKTPLHNATRGRLAGLGVLSTVIAVSATAALAGGGSAVAASKASSLTGAGSTLVAPIMSKWGEDFKGKTGIGITYGAIGSGGGIAQVTARTVDFGASDAPMTPDQASRANDVLQIPWALAATLLSYNVPGVPANKHIHLNGLAIARIYTGRLSYWDDAQLKKLNPKVKLPHLKITPVYRSDGSGDTYVFTDFMSQVNGGWRSQIGNATQVSFPTGIGAKGNSGVAGVIGQTKGSIGYLAVSYVVQNGLSYALIRNAANQYPQPNVKNILSAASAVGNIPASNAISIVNPPKSARFAYPMSTFTYALIPHKSKNATELKQFVKYAVTTGQKFATGLQFAPLPQRIVKLAETTSNKITS